MPKLIHSPTQIPVPGGKQILEYIGRVNSGTAELSVAHMKSPAGWTEPGQRPEFHEWTLVLRGTVHVEHESGALDVTAGQAIIAEPGEWIRYSTPSTDGAEYIAICLPAFELSQAHRDSE